MATESDLRDLLQGPDPEGRATIDVEAVLRRARARRRPRAIAATAAGALALVGVMTPVVLVSQQAAKQESLMVAEDAGGAPEAPGAGDTAVAPPTAATLNSCGMPLVEVPSANGLVLEVSPVNAAAGSVDIPIDVTLRNEGDVTVVGTTASVPVVAFSRDGIVLWYTNGPQDASAVTVDLDPNESMTYSTTFEPVMCAVGDDVAEDSDADGLREGLPAAGVGTYRLSAAIDFVPADGMSGTLLVTGPTSRVELR